MARYDKNIATARRLIHKNGRTISIVKPAVANEDENSPWRGAAVGAAPADTRDAKGVFAKFLKSEIDGKIILFSDYKITIPAADIDNIEITEDEMGTYKKIIAGSKEYRIVDFDIAKPGDQVIVYKIQARV